MHPMKWLPVSLVFVLALGLVLPALAQQNNNSEIPGSVIVFHKFVAGTTSSRGGDPKSSFEISVGCPVRSPGGACLFPEGFRIKLKARWVCPGDVDRNNFICRSTDFNLFTTVFGTVSFNPANVGAPSTFPTPLSPSPVQRVPTPPCPRGYLIAWVVDTSDRPLNFNALVGDATFLDSHNALSAYNGVPIQAVDATAVPPALIAGGETSLPFTGAAGQYARLPNTIQGSLRFEAASGPSVTTDLTLLTLDVLANRPQNPVFLDLDFYNANEILVSSSTEFVCWTEISLSGVNGGDFIDANLTAAGMGTQKGLVVSSTAIKLPILDVVDPSVFPTVLGIVSTSVFQPPTFANFTSRPGTTQAYSYLLYHDDIYVPTFFVQQLGSTTP
jgi:hypothetical protein